ncbi:MAG TPA: PQQ-binding-like beta-propeller repeat protein [Gemmatimonadaceae bacterium]|nr:PQQ-binding-like beta-propeller repeat protein [Gemmatimonadaceae bacterium]
MKRRRLLSGIVATVATLCEAVWRLTHRVWTSSASVLLATFVSCTLLGQAGCHDPPTASTGQGVRELWSQSQNGESQARPLVSNDIVYFGTGTGEIVARDFETGHMRWSTRVSFQSEIAGANMTLRSGVLVATGVWVVAGIDATTGVLRWTYTTPPDTVDAGANPAPGQLVVAHIDANDQVVYVPAWGASVSAVDLQSGQAGWVWHWTRTASDTAANVFRSGAVGTRVSGDTVFVTGWHSRDRVGLTSENWLLALDRRTGQELARVTVASGTGGVSIFGSPALHGNQVIFAGVGGRVWAVDRSTWRVAWQFAAKPKFSTLIAAELHGDTLYIDGGDEYLYAINAADGSPIWKANTGTGATRDLLVTDARVYYPTQGRLKVFDKGTGTFVAEASVQKLGDIFETPPTFARSRVFVATTPEALSLAEP